MANQTGKSSKPDRARRRAKSRAAMWQAVAAAQENTALCTAFNLRKAARAVSQYYESVMQESGIKGTQFSLLASVAGQGPVLMGRLAAHMVMDRTTLTRNLKPLIAQGLVAVAPGEEDRRARVVSLTEDGIRTLREAYPYWREAHAGMTRKLGRAGRDRLLRSLGEVIEAARPD